MKLILRIIVIVISIVLAVVLLLILINLTFFKEYYKTEFMDSDGIPLTKYVYHMNSSTDFKGNFMTFVSYQDLQNIKDNYVDKLESCYGKYYYDDKNHVTLLNYKINDQGMYRTLNIEYQYDNYCSNDYKLEDDWINVYREKSKLEESSITVTNTVLLMLELESAEKVENPIIDDSYESKSTISLLCSQKGANKYTLEIKDFSENEVVVVKTLNNQKKFIVYKLENAFLYLRNLM